MSSWTTLYNSSRDEDYILYQIYVTFSSSTGMRFKENGLTIDKVYFIYGDKRSIKCDSNPAEESMDPDLRN